MDEHCECCETCGLGESWPVTGLSGSVTWYVECLLTNRQHYTDDHCDLWIDEPVTD